MKQIIETLSQPAKAKLYIPGSKSMTNRALLMAALADGVSELFDVLYSEDTRVLIKALTELGVIIQADESTHSCIVGGCAGQLPKKEADLWCGDAGTVLRFLLAVCGANPGSYQFDGSDRLRERPILHLIQALLSQGVKFNQHKLPLEVQGVDGLEGGDIEISGEESSQFLSALLMAAPFAKSAITLRTFNLVSVPYVHMTIGMMAEFGVMVRRLHHTRFSVPVPQRYVARDYKIEPDFSTASYFFAAAALTQGEVVIQKVSLENTKQADAKFLIVLKKMGCEIEQTNDGLSVIGPERLTGVSVDMRDFSDVFMTLAAIAPFASTPTSITNIGHTRLQECDRIKVMARELKKVGVKVEEGPDWLRIHPSQPEGAEINPENDHRIAMSFAIMGLKVPGIVIANAQCVNKTCPQFFTLIQKFYQ